ncbi:MAG: hypothetical protein ACLFST_12850 [Spirochaetia bacterium]
MSEQNGQDRKRLFVSLGAAAVFHIIIFTFISLFGLFEMSAEEKDDTIYVVLDAPVPEEETPPEEPEPETEPVPPRDDRLAGKTEETPEPEPRENEPQPQPPAEQPAEPQPAAENNPPGFSDEIASARSDFDRFLTPSESSGEDTENPRFDSPITPDRDIPDNIDRSEENRALVDKWQEETARNLTNPREQPRDEDDQEDTGGQGGGEGLSGETLRSLDERLEGGTETGGGETAPGDADPDPRGAVDGDSRITWEGTVKRTIVSAPEPDVTAEDFSPYEVTRVKIVMSFTVTPEGFLSSIQPVGNYPYTKVIDKITEVMRNSWKFERGPRAQGQVAIIINPLDS